MWARTANPDEAGYSLLGRPSGGGLEVPGDRLATATVSASLVAHERDEPVAGQWYSQGTHFFNLSLTGRPPSARGRFEAMEGDFRAVGDLFFIPAGQRYLARGGPGRQRSLFVELRPDERLRGEIAVADASSPVLHSCMNLAFERLRDLLLRMAREVREPGFASAILLDGLGVTLLAETLRVLHRVDDNATRKGGLAPWRLRRIEERARDGETIPSLGELAQLCGFSERQLIRAFREETGRTVRSFVQDLAFERARSLLQDTDLPVAQIAGRVGFANSAAFATAFRRSSGESPRSFRAARRRAG